LFPRAAALIILLQASLPDIVLLPELLSLPIRTRLGPRFLYARKRQVRLLLLLPSQESSIYASPIHKDYRDKATAI
jgi:hypothetical protein